MGTRGMATTVWRWWQWLLWGGWCVLLAAASAVASLIVLWGASTTCGNPATLQAVADGRRGFLVVAGFATLVSLVPAARRRHVGRWCTAAVVGALPALAFLVNCRTPASYVGSFCF